MHRHVLYDGTADTRRSLGASTRRSRIGVSRYHVRCPANVMAAAPAQDAHLFVLQLKDQPAHDFWADGRHVPVPFTAKGTMGFFDLRQESQATFEAELDSFHLHLPREAIDDLAADIGATPVADLRVDGDWTQEDQVVRQLAPLLVNAADAPGEASQPFLDHVVLAMTTHIASAYGGMRRRSVRPGSLTPWQLHRAQEMLAADLSGRTSLHEIAEACGLSVSYFSRAFKASNGWTPHSWLQARRVDTARELLLDRTLPLADIALRSGFADQSHFSRVFKNATGQTPGAWRRLNARG